MCVKMNRGISMKYLIVGLLISFTYCKADEGKKMQDQNSLPAYVVINDESQPKDKREILHTKAMELQFPLNDEDKRDVEIVARRFDTETNMLGVAAPQIGITKRIIAFATEGIPNLKEWRPDFTQSMPRTIWVNATYEGLKEYGFHDDYEGCFSVKNKAAQIKRYKKIRYSAFLPDGTHVMGEAEGFLARVIQHEIDHTDGILCIDKANPGTEMFIDEYKKMRDSSIKKPS